ncbi:MAG: hypothetical protein ACSHXB_13025 [Sulfitobacter sp.]
MIRFQPLDKTPIAAENLLPTGLPDLLGYQNDTSPTLLYYARNDSDDPQDIAKMRFNRITPLIVLDESGIVENLPQLDTGRPYFLGPRTESVNRFSAELALPFNLDAEPSTILAPRPIGIIDGGISFWNPAFTKAVDGALISRFDSFGALKMDEGEFIEYETLSKQEINQMVQNGGTRQGDLENRAVMASKFPSSVFGSVPNEQPLFAADGLAHGTAMTEMVLETAQPGSQLHGLELPRSVLRDLSGGLMRAVFDASIRSLVKIAIGLDDEDLSGPPFNMVILAAFGFLGGPQGQGPGAPDFLSNIQKTLDELRGRGINITLVLPMGNHRQDQAHARLKNGQSIDWQIQHDDHSPNTLEIIHEDTDLTLRLAPPGGDPSDHQIALGQTSVIECNESKIGAVSTIKTAQTGWARTRICLAPTATVHTDAPRAPSGRWSIGLPQSREARLWVMRDETGFEADPRRPARQSWLADGLYRQHDSTGMLMLDDPATTGLRVMRAGTASVLTAYQHGDIVTVAAGWSKANGAETKETSYSGASFDGSAAKEIVDLAENAPADRKPVGPAGQRAVLGNGSDNRFRVAGTSLAAALQAGKSAQGGDSPQISEA